MNKSEIHKIIVKFLNKEASSHELELLNNWLETKKNHTEFNRLVKVEYLTTACMSDYDLHKAKKNINKKLKKAEKVRRIAIYKKIAIAASFALLLTLGFIHNNKKETEIVITTPIDIGSSKAILTLENGNQVHLEKGKAYKSEKVSSNGEELVYSETLLNKNTKKSPSYNYLAIPRGGEFFIKLVDGTKVWLNSESKIKYPTEFIKGETRIVELLYGEAYFEVSPSTNHNGDAFKVITKQQEINVLGTEFNIKAYNNEDEIATTLVNGSVQVNSGNTKKTIKPNQQSIINNKNPNSIKVSEIDAMQEIAWVKGNFSFNEETLGDMMQVLSRWYNVEVVFETAERKNYVFTGILERTKSIENILELIQATGEEDIEFNISKKTIIVK
ncbi:FecR family protein [Thalassobellus sediminis]|uniref:FecR family protein n=1 Tax=Thalassobellus sediminis TaxID=3367753 RepID=UPI0037B94A85